MWVPRWIPIIAYDNTMGRSSGAHVGPRWASDKVMSGNKPVSFEEFRPGPPRFKSNGDGNNLAAHGVARSDPPSAGEWKPFESSSMTSIALQLPQIPTPPTPMEKAP